MRIVVFGLTITSSWGNGHATLWRGLTKALARHGCHVTFFERDRSYYATHRDFGGTPGVEVVLYSDWAEVAPLAAQAVKGSDVSIVTSYCPDGAAASDLPVALRHCRLLYDLDTPVTIEALDKGERLAFLSRDGLAAYDQVASFTGGESLDRLIDFGAKKVFPLYGFVDPDEHQPVAAQKAYSCDLSFLGTYAQDRRAIMEELLVEPAQRRAEASFLIAGAQYPADFRWQPNINFIPHLPPSEHAAFFSSCRMTLNVTRGSMKRYGWCPSGRLFEAASCGAPIVTDWFEGLDAFLQPGHEIFVASSRANILEVIDLSDRELAEVGEAGRARVMSQHTADRRVQELLTAIAGGGEHGSISSPRLADASVGVA